MLSRHQISEFQRDGYVLVPELFSSAEIEEMRGAFGRLERLARSLGRSGMHRGSQFVLDSGDAGDLRIQRIVWCGAAEPTLSRFGCDPRLLAMAGQLLGTREMNQLINQAHFKLPGDGVDFPWHQDSTHRRYDQGLWKDLNGRGSYVQTVVAVDEATEENGPLRLIPGSCRLGHVPLPADSRGRLPDELIDEDRAVTATMKPGSVLLFGPFTFHASGPNRSDRPRRVFINGFAYPGANFRTYPGEGAGRLVTAPEISLSA